MMALLSPAVLRAIAVAAVLAGLAWVYHLWADHQREIGRVEVRAEWQADKMARAEANRLLLMVNAKATGALQAAANKERQALHAKNRSIGLELSESLKRLRNRPERPADSGDRVPTATGPRAVGSGCTGAGLFRRDGEFLAGLAADADRTLAALQSCRAAYQRAQEAVNQD